MKKLSVGFSATPKRVMEVGTLAEQDRRVYFEYTPAFLDTGLELSPFRLPARPGVQPHTDLAFGRLPGLFDDSLPDGWGLLLMDRHFRRLGHDPARVSPMDRLAWLGTRTMGALTYLPSSHGPDNHAKHLLDLYEVGRNAAAVFAGEAALVLPELLRAGGSPGGARPKILVGVKGGQLVSGEDRLPPGYEAWLVKFPAAGEGRVSGHMEYAYSLMAAAAGIDMPATRLFEAGCGKQSFRCFAVRRFDRGPGGRRYHVHTFANLVHANFRVPAGDYADVFSACRSLTRSHKDSLRLFRRMAFNVAACNRDDHAKNFAFVLDDLTGEWSLSPAYDLTLSMGPGGEHSTTLLGEGRYPGRSHCLSVGQRADIRGSEAGTILDEVNAAIARWSEFADKARCPKRVAASARRHMRQV